MNIEIIQEFFYLFYSETLYLVMLVFFVGSMFLAIAIVLNAIDET